MSKNIILNRWIVRFLREIALERSYDYRSWSDDWVIRINTNNNACSFIGYRTPLNDSVASHIAQDKVATFMVLNASGVNAIPHELVRTKASGVNGTTVGKESKVVIKPLVGTSGHGVKLFENAQVAVASIQESVIQAWAVSPYVKISSEVRLILLDGVVLCAYEKIPVEVNGLLMSNLGQGAKAVVVKPNKQQITLAISAQKALGLRICSVDVVRHSGSEYAVLEVNDAIMMEHFARQSKEYARLAKNVYESILDAALG